MPRKPVSKKIEAAKERIEKGDKDGSFEFDTQRELCEFIGIRHKAFQDNKEKVAKAGFSYKILPPVAEKIEAARERIEKGDRDGSFEFNSTKELQEYIGISEPSFNAYKEKLAQVGLVFEENVPVEKRIEDAKKRIEKGDRDGSFEFDTGKELREYIGLPETTFYSNKERLLQDGFVFDAGSTSRKIEDAKKRIEKGDRDGSFEFNSTKELREYIGINDYSFYDNKEKLVQAGFVFEESVPVTKRLEDAKKRIEKGDRDGSFEFDTAIELSEYIGMSYSTFCKNKEKAVQAGFVFEPVSVAKRIEDAKKRIEKGDRDGSFEFDTRRELSEYIGINDNSFYSYKEELAQAGLRVLQREVSKNVHLSLEDCIAHGIKLESGELLPCISREFFSRHVRPFENAGFCENITMDIVYDYTLEEKRNAISSAALKLISEDRGDYSLLELKLELFVEGIYLSEESITEALVVLGEDADREDSIEKRLRLSAAFVNYGLVEIEYVGKLPLINNSAGGNILLDKRIQNRKMFMKLWREYALYSIQNKITGTVSKTKIPDDWDGSLDSLFALIPAYEKAYFLDEESIWFLEEIGYEGILAVCQFGSKQSKSELTRMHHSIHARCIGFFLYLNRKKYALMQPKYIVFTGAKSVSDTAKTIMADHVVMSGYEQVLGMDDVPKAERKKLSQKGVNLQALKLSGSIREDCDLTSIESKDIYVYLEHNSHEAISGTIIHETFVLVTLRLLGNLGAIERSKGFDFDTEVLNYKLASRLKAETLNHYKRLLGEMLDVVRKMLEDGQSHGYIKSYLRHIFALMQFLDTFPGKLSRKEMSTALNTVIVSDVQKSFTEWKSDNLSDSQYADFTNKMYVLFDNIATEEYRGLYSRGWKVTNKIKSRTLIREGMNAEVFSILQHVAIYDPARADEYPFAKTTPSGEQLDLGWWPFDFSPVPVICNWLIIKTTRRKVNVRQLDVNKFLHFDEDGNLAHMHFNTDKNRSSKDRNISIHLLRYLFTSEELEFLKKYVEYVKSAYSGMTPVAYESSSKHFEEIMPLFPHHSKNAVIADSWVDGYHIKTMLKTELLLRSRVKEGVFDSFIEGQDRERRKEDLVKMQLVFKKPSQKLELPSNTEGLDSISINSYRTYFTTVYGVHNMRHAGISALGAQLPLVYVRMIAGHADINTTARVYFHANDEIIGNEILNGGKASLNEPIGASSKFIRRRIMPMIESGEPEKIEEILKENHFMSVSREIQDGLETKMIEDGMAHVAKLHPSLWIPQKHGMCGNNQQCPAGTNGCCALCPFNIFSPMHVKGVLYELNSCMDEITLISQKVALDSRANINATREEMKGAHQQKIIELAAWFEVLDMIMDKISGLSGSDTENLPRMVGEHLKKGLYSVGACSIEESTMELLVDASELKIDNLDTDNRVAKMSHKLMQAAIQRKDYDFLERMASDGIQRIVDEFGKKAMGERKEYLLQQLLGTDRLADSPASLNAGNKAMELLPTI